jgi:hypothetical protein
MMRRLLIAATLGLGLLSAGGMAADAAAVAGTRGHAAPARAEADDGHLLLTPAHYQRDFHHHGHRRPHYAPPPPLRHHWHRVAPPPARYHDGHARDRRYDRHPHGWQ